MPSHSASIVTIERFLAQVGATGLSKSAEARSEPGSIGGPTEHPIKNVDDSLQASPEGSRSAENKADVKKDQPLGIDNTPVATSEGQKKADDRSTGGDKLAAPGSAEEDQLQIGTHKAPTGDDPSVETGSTKPGKDDTETSHPAKTDNDSLNGGKYAADLTSGDFDKVAAALVRLGNSLLAQIAADDQGGPQKTASDKNAATQNNTQAAAQAGWELAGLFGGNLDKQAADAMAIEKVAAIIEEAVADADEVVAYLQKRAEGEMPTGQVPGGQEAMMAALGGGGMGGAGMGGAGGEAAMGDPSTGGSGGDDAELAQLMQLLEESGLSIEDLEALLANEGGGGADPAAGGGGPPAGGGAPEGASGSEPKTAAAKSGNAHKDTASYVRELIKRSKQ